MNSNQETPQQHWDKIVEDSLKAPEAPEAPEAPALNSAFEKELSDDLHSMVGILLSHHSKLLAAVKSGVPEAAKTLNKMSQARKLLEGSLELLGY